MIGKNPHTKEWFNIESDQEQKVKNIRNDEVVQVAGYNAHQVGGSLAFQVAGHKSFQSSRNESRQFAGANSVQVSGADSTLFCGQNSIQSASKDSTLIAEYRDNDYVLRVAVGYIGEDGLKPNTPYKFNGKTMKFEEVGES